jgi:serine/threonine-protein kinase
MAPLDANRNLLFGILALQASFIDRDQLLDAFHRWTENKTLPLGRILLERGALNEGRLTFLQALVAEHLKLHDGDPEKSLAALSSLGSARLDLEQVNDPDVQQSLRAVSAARSDELDDPYRTRTGTVGEPTSTGLRFRILRPHAKGGLGQVSVALDSELDRPVALKEIQDKHADEPASRARFVQEAEITGKLEHPGIVPVYGLGHYADGRPFYAMRFIQGDSLKEAIKRFHAEEALRHDHGARGLRLRELLRRFTDVCNALAYAHSRGVLHRDLKPGNVMLGPFGETLVVDWGLAKPLGAASGLGPSSDSLEAGGPIRLSALSGSCDETMAGSAVGTPAYMSPEQAAGRLDLLGPGSDVYGLGAILYAILTGRAPVITEEMAEILGRVQKGEIAQPRSIDPSIPRALEAICLKAMSRDIPGRYVSARDLARDIDRWLADEPVSAWREPVVARTRRWMRRHRTLTTAATAGVLVALISLGIAYRREAAYGAKLAGINQSLDEANTKLTQDKVELDARNLALDHQRKRAEQRETLALDAVKKFRDAVASNAQLKNRPELEPLRKTLLKEPLEFFRKLRDQLKADADTGLKAILSLIEANLALGYTTTEIGSVSDAIQSYSEAIGLLRPLVRDNPTVAAYQNDLACSYDNIGTLLSHTGRPDEALKAYNEALSIQQRLTRDNPTVTAYQNDLAGSYDNIGNLLTATGRLDEALKAQTEALRIQQRLASANPTVTAYRKGLGATQNNIGLLLSDMGRLDEALKTYNEALRIRQRLTRENPTATAYQYDLAASHFNIGNLLRDTGRLDEALKTYNEAPRIQQRLTRENPTVTAYQQGLVLSHSNIGNLLRDTGRPDEALKAYNEVLSIFERLTRENPTVTAYQQGLVLSHSNIGNLLRDTGRPCAK